MFNCSLEVEGKGEEEGKKNKVKNVQKRTKENLQGSKEKMDSFQLNAQYLIYIGFLDMISYYYIF